MIRDRYVKVEEQKSAKGPKPKPVTRPQGKEVPVTPRDMQPARNGGRGYKTR
ncbi:hypothetical protein [Mesorhizobium silamurunense]|uniref:hypothetical protein n=1 Tax=Mesorhizobium silamurunense TaxID=499528 RepID=UPI00177F13CF|nr:hypothetical protein [Mesorhizobium silamurunense]